ncbi:MAG: acetyl-CoA acetyltransferase [Rhodothalassiaceae bacterium]
MSAGRHAVIVGVAQSVDRDEPSADSPSPQDRLAEVARQALADSGASGPVSADTVAVVRLFSDSAPNYQSPFGKSDNYPLSLARRLGWQPARLLYPVVGGNTPQALVNALAEKIAQGRSEVALIAGVEAIRTSRRAAKLGLALDWSETTGQPPKIWGEMKWGCTGHEMAHGIAAPSEVYPLFETALMHAAARTPQAHRQQIGELMARLSKVAADNPFAAQPVARSPEELITPSTDNRLVAWPYTKFLNANDSVDQAAAVLMMSAERADALGVPPDRRIHLWGSAELTDKWFVSDRVAYDRSPAIERGAAAALDQAGVGLDDIALFDLYSCFPSAVEIACQALGLAQEDPRGLTVTGGLPYFGGPGNNYSLHAIAEMAARLRARPTDLGLITANGWYLTKHAMAVYGARPPRQLYRRRDLRDLQTVIDTEPSPPVSEAPTGPARIETYTVSFDRTGPSRAILIGRLKADGARFIANIPAEDADALASLMAADQVGQSIEVHTERGRSRARLV